jgi:hypothetical protein
VYLWHVFLVKPLAALSILISLATIFSLFSLERRRPQHSSDRFLIAFLGLLSVYQAMRILESAGLVSLQSNAKLDDAIELIVTVFYLLAALLLRLSSMNRLDAESALRLARAAPPRTSRPEAMETQRPLDAVEKLNWALPKVNDGAFRLYAYLLLHVDSNKGPITLNDSELKSLLGQSIEDIHGYLRELERLAAISVIVKSDTGGGMTVDLNGRASTAPIQEELPSALSVIRG